MHDRSSTIKVNKKELLGIDIEQACIDLRNYIPSGKLETVELRNKMSLYLLAQLSYGVTLVLGVHADYLIDDLKKLLHSMMRQPIEVEGGTVKRERKPRKRRTADAILEPITAEQLLEEEERETRKKRRTSQRTTKPSLLNLSDARAYVDQQVPGTARRTEASMEELHALEEMFMDYGEQVQLPPPEWPPLEEHRAEEPRPKISIAEIFPSMTEKEEFIRELGEPILTQDVFEKPMEPQPLEEVFGPELPAEQARSPYQTEERVEEMFDELKLDALPDLVIPAPRPRRRPRGLIIDERTELTHEAMLKQLEDISDIIRTREELHAEIMRTELPPLSVLFDPLPRGMSEKLRPLFETVLKDYRERPLTFQEAQRMTDEDLHVRRFGVDVASWRSTPNETRISNVQPEQITELSPPPPTKIPRQRVSIFEEAIIRPEEAELGELAEQPRRETLQRTISVHEPKVSTVVDETFVAQPVELSLVEQPRDEVGYQDISLPRESVFLKPSPELEEEVWIDAEMDTLYSQIIAKQGTDRNSIYYDEVTEELKGNRKMAARRFFTLLKLLKHGKIKARQMKAYGRIEVRVIKSGKIFETSVHSEGEDGGGNI